MAYSIFDALLVTFMLKLCYLLPKHLLTKKINLPKIKQNEGLLFSECKSITADSQHIFISDSPLDTGGFGEQDVWLDWHFSTHRVDQK